MLGIEHRSSPDVGCAAWSPTSPRPAGRAQVRPPDAPDWERTAVNWLLDLCPPEYRCYPALRRHVVVLARFAVLHVEACQAAVRRGLSEARAELRDARRATCRGGGRDLAGRGGPARRRTPAVGLVEEALRGRRFVARL